LLYHESSKKTSIFKHGRESTENWNSLIGVDENIEGQELKCGVAEKVIDLLTAREVWILLYKVKGSKKA